ncbi:MAG: hypothetical protein ACRDSZ_12170 [Pseudonocardiaceae bacterium]
MPPRHRRRGRAATGTGAAVDTSPVITMTDARTRRAHLVTDAAVAAGRADGGRYVAVCGIAVLPASLTTPETSHCVSCDFWRRRQVQAALGRGRTVNRNGSGGRWGWIARMW